MPDPKTTQPDPWANPVPYGVLMDGLRAIADCRTDCSSEELRIFAHDVLNGATIPIPVEPEQPPLMQMRDDAPLIIETGDQEVLVVNPEVLGGRGVLVVPKPLARHLAEEEPENGVSTEPAPADRELWACMVDMDELLSATFPDSTSATRLGVAQMALRIFGLLDDGPIAQATSYSQSRLWIRHDH
jgi:hypothetical protein